MSKFEIHFCNIAPDCVEVAYVDQVSLEGIKIPDDAMQFIFFEQREGTYPFYVGPYCWVTDNIDISDNLDDLKAKYPGVQVHHKEDGDNLFGLVSWSHPDGPQWNGKIIVALREGIVLVERKTARQVWPVE